MSFSKRFCNKSPFKSGFALWKQERDMERKDRKFNRRLEKGKYSTDPNMPHLGPQKTPRGGWPE